MRAQASVTDKEWGDDRVPKKDALQDPDSDNAVSPDQQEG